MRILNKLGVPFFALAVASALVVGGCGANSPSVNARAVARGAASTMADAWNAAAHTCVQLAVSQDSQDTLDKCQEILDPARDALIAAGQAVNAWSSADQNNFPCLIQQGVKGVQAMVAFLQTQGVSVPSVVVDGLSLASQFTCVQTFDGGAE